ncbi:MAG: hypothetical protein QW540_08650 [Archaeoglobaceae archaeon]
MNLDESIWVYFFWDRYTVDRRMMTIASIMHDVRLKVFLETGKLEKMPKYFSKEILFLSRHKYYKKLKKLLGDNAMDVEQFERMIKDLTILTDGERLFSMSSSENIPAVRTPVQLSRLVYEEFGYATVLHDPMDVVRSPYDRPEELENIELLRESWPVAIRGLFDKTLLKHYGRKEVALPDLIRNNEKFMTSLVEKYDTMYANMKPYSLEETYAVRVPNTLFPIDLLNPLNPTHQKALIVHKLAKISPELLLVYSYPEKIPDDIFKSAMSLAHGHSEIISILPEEAQIRALALL